MKKSYFLMVVSAVVMSYSLLGFAQTPHKTGSASISGRVTVGGKAVSDLNVIIVTTVGFRDRIVARATTDEDGNYRLSGLPAGSFRVFSVANSFAMTKQATSRFQTGQAIQLSEGEAVTDFDIRLSRGGVITGRVTDAEGSPIIGEQVVVINKEAADQPSRMSLDSGNRTDDRGIYRVYGLLPGFYRLSLGSANSDSGMSRLGSQYTRTFYPGVTEESKATFLEVKEGQETSNVDFSVGKPPTGFAVTGRVVDGATGQPVPNMSIGFGAIDQAEQRLEQMDFSPTPTDSNGKFRIEGLQNGSYAIFTMGVLQPGQSNKSYSELSKFEVAGADVTGVEIKLRRGATIKGTAVIENSEEAEVFALLQTAQLYASNESSELAAPSFDSTKILSDGTFSFSGLGPGRVRIGVQGYPTPPKGLNLVRVELNGMAQEAIEVSAGADVTGVRLVFHYGTGSLRGRVTIEGGVLPEGARLWVMLTQPANPNQRSSRYGEVDARGRFFVEHISPGTYEMQTRVGYVTKDGPKIQPVTKSVVIANGVETEITIVLNVTPGKP